MSLPAKKVSFAPSVTSYVFFNSCIEPLDIETSPLQDQPLITISEKHKLRHFLYKLTDLDNQSTSLSSLTKKQTSILLQECDSIFHQVLRSKDSFSLYFLQMKQGKCPPQTIRNHLDALIYLESKLSILKVSILVAQLLNK